MVVYRFKPVTRTDQRVALTTDASGKNLPGDGAPWQAIGELDLEASDPWVKTSKAEIEEALARTGFFLWTISVPQPVLKRKW